MLIAAKRPDDAMAFVKEVQKSLPGAPLGLLLEGEVYEAKGEFDEALSLYRRLVKDAPVGGFAVKVYESRRRGGDEGGALEELKQWVSAHPGELAARGTLADALSAKGDFKSAIAHYETILDQDVVPTRVLNNLAWAYYVTKDDRAISTAKMAVDAAPNNANLLDTLGWIMLQQGSDIDHALGLLTRAALIAPDSIEIRYHLAAGLAKQGKIEAARTDLKRLLALDREFPSRAEAQTLLDAL